MKSGRHIYASMRQGCGDAAAIHALGNGELRSLIRYIEKHDYHREETGGIIMGIAMVEAADRFVEKGKGKNL